MTDKSAEAFRTISEVAEDIGVPQHVLRFWETRFAAIKPLKRGGNRRYYRPEDVELLRTINRLLYTDGYTIKGVQKLLKEKGASRLAGSGLAAPDAGSELQSATRKPAPLAEPAQLAGDAAFTASLKAISDRLKAALAEARAA
jgi:DNA-binding transcriptional MerR regulator